MAPELPSTSTLKHSDLGVLGKHGVFVLTLGLRRGFLTVGHGELVSPIVQLFVTHVSDSHDWLGLHERESIELFEGCQEENGVLGGNRTHNLSLRRRPLYPVELRGQIWCPVQVSILLLYRVGVVFSH